MKREGRNSIKQAKTREEEQEEEEEEEEEQEDDGYNLFPLLAQWWLEFHYLKFILDK